jgi:antitoxin component YwqK of YwqJK toxin-antitoxin module
LTVYNPDGSKSRELPYVNGELDGTIRPYYDGNDKVYEEQQVRQGVMEGKYSARDIMGNPYIEAVYHNNLLDGPVKIYDDKGHLSTQIPYVKGVAEGEAVGYYPNGTKLFTVTFKNNRMEGWRKTYHSNGQVYQEKLYKNGAWTGKDYREYDKEGYKKFELSEDNYRLKASKFDDDGKPTDLSEEELNALFNRIDTRKYEKEMMDRYLNLQKDVGSYMQGSY